MKWTEVIIRTTTEASDAVTDMLTSIGTAGVSIEDPDDIRKEVQKSDSLDYADDKFLSSLGDDVVIKSYFPGEMNAVELSGLLKEKMAHISNFLDIGKGSIEFSEIDEEDWSTSWKKYYKPFRLSERVVIKPSWEDYKQENGEIIVELDPGMAFGTGTHETTKLCAQFLEKYLKSGNKVMDIGCGTGILSIIAVKLGAGHVTAVDIDEVAVKVTKENSSINKVANNIDSFRGVLTDIPQQKADIIIANIIANVIIDISRDVPAYLKRDAYFITSGIIKERKQEVIDAYLSLGFSCEETAELGEWVAIVFKCQSSL